jgi:hypothetical protein
LPCRSHLESLFARAFSLGSTAGSALGEDSQVAGMMEDKCAGQEQHHYRAPHHRVTDPMQAMDG